MIKPPTEQNSWSPWHRLVRLPFIENKPDGTLFLKHDLDERVALFLLMDVFHIRPQDHLVYQARGFV